MSRELLCIVVCLLASSCQPALTQPDEPWGSEIGIHEAANWPVPPKQSLVRKLYEVSADHPWRGLVRARRGDEIWSYDATGEAGYALVRNGTVIDGDQTICRLPVPPRPPTRSGGSPCSF